MFIYLDIDGTLIDKKNKPVKYLKQFLEYLISRHDVFWLTTHCRQENRAVEHIMNFLSEDFRPLVEKIKPVYWDVMKTEGIDVEQDFRWLDDCILESEKRDLIDLGLLSSHYLVDLSRDQEIFNPESSLFRNFFN